MKLRLDEGAGHLLRELAPQVLGVLVRRYHDFAAAEDAVQEALVAAAAQWSESGMPHNPRGWLIRVATRRMADHVRSEHARRRREAVVAQETAAATVPSPEDADASERDDTLLLMFMCCHPALTPASSIARSTEAMPSAFLRCASRGSRARDSTDAVM